MVTRDTRLPLCAVGLGSLATPDHSLSTSARISFAAKAEQFDYESRHVKR